MASSDDARNFKTAVVTGATDGLGRATALMLAANGYRVFGGGRNAAKLASLQNETFAAEAGAYRHGNGRNQRRICGPGDRDDSECQPAPIDILVNNAGIGFVAPMEEISLADLRCQFETNVFGVVRVTQHVLPGMRAQGRRPHREHELDCR